MELPPLARAQQKSETVANLVFLGLSVIRNGKAVAFWLETTIREINPVPDPVAVET